MNEVMLFLSDCPMFQVRFKHNAILAVYEHLAEEFRKLFGEACNSSIIAQMMPKLFINELLGVLLVWGNKRKQPS
jgi:hypothetical protein